MIKQLVFPVAVLAATAGCAQDETVAAYGGADKTWTLVEIDNVAFEAAATLSFPETGRIAGKAPCNQYTGAMTAPYPWFETGPIASTRMICPDDAAEMQFFSALEEMSLSEVVGDTLILSTPEGRKMVFTSAE